MKYIILIVALGLAVITKSATSPGPNKWFAADEIFSTDYGSISSASSPVAADFDDNLPLPAQPTTAVDPDPGQCLQNTERICAALFTTDTDVNSGNSPIFFANQIVFGEFKHR